MCKKILLKLIIICEFIALPFTIVSAKWLGLIRQKRRGFRLSWKILKKIEVIPIINHYYEPLISKNQLSHPLGDDRNLPAIDFNDNEQLAILDKFHWQDELLEVPREASRSVTDYKDYYYNNGAYGAGDGEYLYSIIRLFKPKKIIEIGSGNSTLMSLKAIRKNKEENSDYVCKFICVEPYEQNWLSKIDEIQVIRKKVEEIKLSFFQQLDSEDILFIDSSHVIRPQGDVLYEYGEIIPSLKQGVIIHVHDILTPKDYLQEWVLDEIRLWNEQYLLEAFLAYNSHIEIIGALNYLKKHYWKELASKCPILAMEKEYEVGAFWMRKKN